METDRKPVITGGPLISDYEFVQFHFHWGANDDEGSENTINNNRYTFIYLFCYTVKVNLCKV